MPYEMNPNPGDYLDDSDDDAITQPTPAQRAMSRCGPMIGSDATKALLRAHGSPSGRLRDVPAHRLPSCTAALNRAADGGPGSAPASMDRISPEKVYARWNNPPSMKKEN